MASYNQGPRYDLVDQAADIKPALAKLREHGAPGSPSLAVDCEGASLSRKGVLSIVSVATENHAYLFDIKALGAKVFDEGLKELLQDSGREKLMFDCRSDSDCLWHQYKVKLTNVLDLQLLQIIYRETHPEPKPDKPEAAVDERRREAASRMPVKNFPPVLGLRSFLRCLELYVDDEDLTTAKKEGKEKMEQEGMGIWMNRPLDEALLAYAAADVRGFFFLYRALSAAITRRDDKERMRKGSQNFLNYLRSRSVRTFDEYERNPFLPNRILPESGREKQYAKDVECVGCKSSFPREDFIPQHIRKRIQKCPVCRKVYWQSTHSASEHAT